MQCRETVDEMRRDSVSVGIDADRKTHSACSQLIATSQRSEAIRDRCKAVVVRDALILAVVSCWEGQCWMTTLRCTCRQDDALGERCFIVGPLQLRHGDPAINRAQRRDRLRPSRDDRSKAGERRLQRLVTPRALFSPYLLHRPAIQNGLDRCSGSSARPDPVARERSRDTAFRTSH